MYLSINQSIYLSIYQSIYLSIYQSLYKSISLIYQLIYFSIIHYHSIYQSFYIYQSINQSINQSLHQSHCPSTLSTLEVFHRLYVRRIDFWKDSELGSIFTAREAQILSRKVTQSSRAGRQGWLYDPAWRVTVQAWKWDWAFGVCGSAVRFSKFLSLQNYPDLFR